jgi:hypothetical protein
VVGGLDHDVTAAWRPPLPQAQVREDLLDDRRSLDHGDQPHLAPAPLAHQNVFPPHPPEEVGPCESASADWIIRPRDVVGGVLLGLGVQID